MSTELQQLTEKLSELETALANVQSGGVSSASFSSGAGSKSVTYMSPSAIRDEIDAIRRRIGAIRNRGAAAVCYYPFGG